MALFALIVASTGNVLQLEQETFEVHPDFTWVTWPDGTKPGSRYVDGSWVAPVVPTVPTSRVLDSETFFALFTPVQVAALWSADPLLMSGAIKVMLQGDANLDSPEAASLLSLAVSKGVLTDAERTRILAGKPPTGSGSTTPAASS